MRFSSIALFFVLVATIHPSQAQESPPTLSLVEAAKIAEMTLKEMNLPDDYFIRSVMLSPSKNDQNTFFYEARFEPPARRIIRRSDISADESEPEAIKFKVIIVTMDGKASMEEREWGQARSIQRRIVPQEGSPTN
jgi:hypothetical protein